MRQTKTLHETAVVKCTFVFKLVFRSANHQDKIVSRKNINSIVKIADTYDIYILGYEIVSIMCLDVSKQFSFYLSVRPFVKKGFAKKHFLFLCLCLLDLEAVETRKLPERKRF